MALFGVGDGLRINTDQGEADLLFGVADPSAMPGKAAPLGSMYLRSNGITFKKVGPLDTDWLKASQAEGSGVGYVFVTNVVNTGNVGDKIYVPNTVPVNTVLTECSSDTLDVTINFLAEPAGAYSPTLTLSGVQCNDLSQYGDDRRLFSGSFDVTLTCPAGEYQDFFIESSTGQSASVRINRAGAGPMIQSITFGNYPGVQTALKENDTIGVTVVVENSATAVWIEADKASKTLVNLALGAVDGAGVGYRNATGTVTISNVTPDSPVDAQAENALGTKGDVFTSANLNIDQVYPTVTFNSITYPAGQGALKASETADVSVTLTNWTNGVDTVTYSTPLSQITIPSTSVYSQVKTVTRVGGTYNISSNNYSISATKVSNAATTLRSYVVKIASVAAQLTIVEPATRLRTGGTGYSNVGLTVFATVAEHLIRINSNQVLNAIPTLANPLVNTGVWKNGAFINAGSMTTFTNTLQLDDDAICGTHDWQAISGTNLAGITTVVVTGDNQYVIGGSMPRYYLLVLGQNEVIGDMEITDYSKFSLEWRYIDGSGQVKALSRSAVIGSLPPVTAEYTIEAEDTNPTKFIILDTAASQSMTQNTVIYVQEVV